MSEDRARAYTEAGVDINAGNALVSRIKNIVAQTHTNGVLSDIGGFGGLFKPDLSGMEEPVLVASTDGVGTKLKLAFMFDKHDTVGIDLVAMSVNDILVQGAKPLFFLDYFATGKLDVDKAQQVVAGVAEGCKRARSALLGGETAEMPSMYADGEYDLAGFCVGIADNARIVDGSSIRVHDVVIGLASTGPHSNGYTLVRKLLDKSGLKPADTFPGTDRTVAEVLLEPTAIYVETVRNLMRDFEIKGMVHVTGGGFYDNLPRVLPASVQANISFGSWDIEPVFHWLKEQGELSWPEMLQIFNTGIGYVLIVSADVCEEVMGRLEALHQNAWVIGTIERRQQDDSEQVHVNFPE
ncbi:phosphoribosylformylglycinamidine cyclo-ligase [Desulfovibrio mangrovi]|uniref:phosphoribosylformylglycinamidine cyclo-ligase n=1 Tax=Desulfovibrio mangrovi TaxID=2976983 RepID=UPI0022457CF3|nr:phosphoribosylformylglycinamidine cyclo-ligase [Desulfovibrio mangrovi]UZP68144.1 phosphoribosylformylglycinamidine cyclo-ligase [Desulfovibrio mangrovi]